MATQTHLLQLPEIEPWPEPVNGELLLNEMLAIIRRFVVLPKCAGETLALWTLHTYAFHLRDVSTYLGLESPVKRCGKTPIPCYIPKSELDALREEVVPAVPPAQDNPVPA